MATLRTRSGTKLTKKVIDAGRSSQWLDLLQCGTFARSTPVLIELCRVHLGPGKHKPELTSSLGFGLGRPDPHSRRVELKLGSWVPEIDRAVRRPATASASGWLQC